MTRVTTFLFLLGMSVFQLNAQTRTIERNNQYWIGYITSTRISKQYSLWNDFHLVPNSFGLLRTGLTREFGQVGITAGYAFGWLSPGSGNTSLIRHEHRPWAQAQVTLPLSGPYSMTQRFRYEARFRENVLYGEVTDGYSFTNRMRYQINVRRNLCDNPERKVVPYVVLSEEVLLHFGRDVKANVFDQNRILLGFGLQSRNTQYQVGIMNRFVQTGPEKFASNNTLVLWITQKFDWRNIGHRSNAQDDSSQ